MADRNTNTQRPETINVGDTVHGNGTVLAVATMGDLVSSIILVEFPDQFVVWDFHRQNGGTTCGDYTRKDDHEFPDAEAWAAWTRRVNRLGRHFDAWSVDATRGV